MKQYHTDFRRNFTPVKMGARFYFRSQTGVILEGKYRFSKSEAREFCEKANKIMDEVETLRKTLFKLAIGYRVCEEKDKKKFEGKMKEKEKEMSDTFNQILDL